MLSKLALIQIAHARACGQVVFSELALSQLLRSQLLQIMTDPHHRYLGMATEISCACAFRSRTRLNVLPIGAVEGYTAYVGMSAQDAHGHFLFVFKQNDGIMAWPGG